MSDLATSSRAVGAAGKLRYAVAPLALVASSALVWHASDAAFKADTSNGTNNWAAGTVVLSDDDAGSAFFNVSNLKPGDTGSKCIAVTYEGSVAAVVKLYGTASGNLAQYLNLTVEQGTGGNSSTCSGFNAASTVYNGTLSGFASTHQGYSNGAGTWGITNPPAARTFRFSYSLADNNAAQGHSANATFTWEAQSA